MIVAFTGHRPDKLGGYKLPNPTYIKVCREIEKALKELKPEKVLSGMALGVDQWAANIAYKLDIPFVAVIPFEGQEKAWPEESQKTFRLLRKLAAEEVIVCPGGYAPSKMQTRNEWLVDNCDTLIPIWDGTSGGTGNCVKYAESIHRTMYRIDPSKI
jgi:uncharacterized phage-like protein YoqJ